MVLVLVGMIFFLTSFKYRYIVTVMTISFFAFPIIEAYCWLPKEAAQWMIEQYGIRDRARRKQTILPYNHTSSSPFISGAGFRESCQHHCDEFSEYPYSLNVSDIKDGDFIFGFCAHRIVQYLHKVNATYTLVGHYLTTTDQSYPDGQTDFHPGLHPVRLGNFIKSEYDKKKLLAYHGVNLWWYNITIHEPRPDYLHCLPLGIENKTPTTGHRVGEHPEIYIEALRKYVIERKNYSLKEEKSKPLLLVGFREKNYAPDRKKVMDHLNAIYQEKKLLNSSASPFYFFHQFNHSYWLSSINQYRFALAPFGHGLDTYRLYEILLMGGIPVTRKSSISSCYDDSDNTINGITRGSLPIVFLNSWDELTEERLETEWNRIVSYPKEHWDWKRLTMDHWLKRIGSKRIK